VPRLAIVIALTIGFVVGLLSGHFLGVRLAGKGMRFWLVALGAFVLVWAIDLGGYLVGRSLVSYGSLGMMAGLLAGLKYGAFPSARAWENQAETHDAPKPEGPDASDVPGS
jgi:hypothetical protein